MLPDVSMKRGNHPEGPRGEKGSTGFTEPLGGKTAGKPVPDEVSTRLQRIAELAREDPQRALLSLANRIDVGFLHEAYRRTRKDGATGVDGQTAKEYEERLWENLQSLHERFKSGLYRAPAVRRTYVPKGDGKQRPIGIPTFEDKVLQRAVTMVLEAVYEQDFLPVSYGYRPGRSAHMALEELWQGLMKMGGGWIVELDITSFFDTLDHARLRQILDRRVRDGVVRRTIDKWLAAGVMEGGQVRHSDVGTPQGGVVSPCLANVYLHEVLDVWFEKQVKPRLRGRGFMLRFADDAVLVFSNEADARQVLRELPDRFGSYGLQLHPAKTRLIHFVPPRAGDKDQGGHGDTSFDFLGFTHHWARGRRGRWVVRRRTARTRVSRALKAASEWLRSVRHAPIEWQHKVLGRKLRGHYNYYYIRGNSSLVYSFRAQVRLLWKKWLDRRSHKARMTWKRFEHVLAAFPLPAPRVTGGPYPHAANP